MGEIFFLGTGGGRFSMITQARSTAGFRLNTENFKIHVDPGPGALLKCRDYKQDPQKLDALIATHGHTDHCGDLRGMIEGMTRGGFKKRGTLIVAKSVVEDVENTDASLSTSYLDLPETAKIIPNGDKTVLEKNGQELIIETLEARHNDPTAFGLRFNIKEEGLVVSYTGDTSYFDELPKIHKGSDIVIANLTRPRDYPIEYHLSPENAVPFLKEANPKLALLTHFGLKIVNSNPVKEAQYIEKESGVRTLAARDGLSVSLNEVDQATLKEF